MAPRKQGDVGNPQAIAALGIYPREFAVLEQLAAGLSNKEIARALGVSPNTIKTHVARLFEKLGAVRRTDAIARARELGIVGDFGQITRSGDCLIALRRAQCPRNLTNKGNVMKSIVIAGPIAGGFAGLWGCLMCTGGIDVPMNTGMAIGYLTMLIGLSTVFLAVKRRRDADQGGVIRFWPALGLGLAISVVAALVYALAGKRRSR